MPAPIYSRSPVQPSQSSTVSTALPSSGSDQSSLIILWPIDTSSSAGSRADDTG